MIDVRFVPLAQLSLSLCGAAALGWALSRLALADAAALGLALVAVFWADSRSRVLRHWVDWNYSGLEAKELWPAWQELTERLRGGPSDARVAVEYGPVHERAGSIRMYETLPWFSGRSTLEGVYNQASTTTHPVYYLASELFARSPNPFRSRRYSSFDPESALARLRLFNVSQIVAVSPELASALDARPDLVREAVIPPYTLYSLREPGPGYVEPLALAPVRADPRTWRDASYRWFSRKPANRALLVFTDDTRFDLVLDDAWGPPPERPLPHDARVTERIEAEAIHITTSRPGHPLLVKVSYHPRWRAEGADGPYLVSPGLMLVVPRQPDVRLAYAARTWADRLGRTLFLAAVGAGLVLSRRRSRQAPAPAATGPPARLLWVLPLALVAALASLRFLPRPGPPVDVAVLDERASRAFAEERWEAAAEYARHAIDLVGADDARRNEWLTLRGEALLRSGEARLAVLAFAPVVDVGSGPYRAQALYSGALAREATGDAEGASAWRRSLRADHPGTPWAERLDEPARPGERALARGALHLANDRVRRGPGVLRFRDRTADHQVVGARGERGRGRRRARLVAARRSRRADTGCHDQEAGAAGLADERDLVGGRHDAVHARVLREEREPPDGVADAAADADLPERRLVVAGEDRDRQQLRAHRRQRAHRRLQHGAPAEAVEGGERHAELCGARDGSGHGVGDVVELQVEEHALAAPDDLAHELGSRGGEGLAAQLEEAHPAREAVHELARGVGLRHVDSDDESLARRHPWPPVLHSTTSPGYWSVPTTSPTSSSRCRSR